MLKEAQAFTAAGYQVTVVCPTGPQSREREITIDGVRVVRFQAPPLGRSAATYVSEYLLSGWGIGACLHRLSETPYAAVIACNPPDFLLQLARPFRRGGAALVFDWHDPAPELFEAIFARRGPLHRLLLAIERFAFRTADVVLTVNDACAELARSRGRVPSDRVFVVRNFPDPRQFFAVDASEALRRGREHLVLWAGRMSRKERLDRLLDAADELVNRRGRRDVSFAIVGTGDVRDGLVADSVRRGLSDFVHFPGHVDDQLLRQYMATADICVSLDERNAMNDRSLMIKVFEYMLMGCAVVQFPLEEMRRVCGDATVYARDGDSLDLANQIDSLLAEPERRAALGAAARERVVNGLTWPDEIPTLLDGVRLAMSLRRASLS